MARVIGTYNRSYNNEVIIPAPIDARTLVDSYEDLTMASNWVDKNGNSIVFNGLIVSVANAEDTTNNGLYFLFDPNADPNMWEDPDVTNIANWHKIGENSDVTAFTSRLNQIESDLASITARVVSIESKATQTYAQRVLFPESGIEGKLYIALDTEKTYIWVNNQYLCVGDDTESYTVISGGNADR